MAFLSASGRSVDVLFVGPGQDDFKDAGALGGEELFFQSADGEDFAAQRDFAGHGDVATDGDLGEGAGEGGGHGDAGGGAVFGDGALGDVEVQVEVAIEVALRPRAVALAADVAESGLRGLLHDVAELAGDGELAFAVEDLNLGGEDAAADFGPGEAGDEADFAGCRGLQSRGSGRRRGTR